MASTAEAKTELAETEPALTPPPSTGRFAAFSHRNFAIFWVSLIVTNTGTWMALVAEGWLITDLEPERKSFYVGLISLAFALPMLTLPPFGGVFADRLPKLTAMRLTQIAFILINSTVALLTLTGRISVPVLVVAAFLSATVLAFDSPVRHSMVPDLVPRAQLTSAVSINAVAFSAAGLIGPAVAGLLIPLISPGGVFLVNACLSTSVLIALRLMTGLSDDRRVKSIEGGNNPRLAVARAFRHLRDSPQLLGLFLVALVAGFFGRAYGPMLPVMSRDVYDVGSTANGVLISAAGLGALAGGLGLSAISADLTRRGRLTVVLILAQGVLLAVFAAVDSYVVGVITLALMGALGAAVVALIMTLVQENVPQELRGRVIGFFLLTFISFPSAGAFLVGLVADLTTIQWALAIFAAIVVAGTITLAARNPTLLTTE